MSQAPRHSPPVLVALLDAAGLDLGRDGPAWVALTRDARRADGSPVEAGRGDSAQAAAIEGLAWLRRQRAGAVAAVAAWIAADDVLP